MENEIMFEMANEGPQFPAEKRPEEFDNSKEACPHCGVKNFAKRLTPESIHYAAIPETIQFKCLFCHKTYYKTFGGIRILRGEESVRKHPRAYIGHPEWGELAEQLIKEKEEEKKKRKPTCLDMANGFGHDQAKKMGIPLSDNISFDSWLERQRKE